MKAIINVGDTATYLPGQNGSWTGRVVEIIPSNTQTKRHGHTGDVYILEDTVTAERISTRRSLLKLRQHA